MQEHLLKESMSTFPKRGRIVSRGAQTQVKSIKSLRALRTWVVPNWYLFSCLLVVSLHLLPDIGKDERR